MARFYSHHLCRVSGLFPDKPFNRRKADDCRGHRSKIQTLLADHLGQHPGSVSFVLDPKDSASTALRVIVGASQVSVPALHQRSNTTVCCVHMDATTRS